MCERIRQTAESDGQILTDQRNVFRHSELHGSEVPNPPYPRSYQSVGNFLCMRGRHGDDADLNAAFGDDLGEVRNVLDTSLAEPRSDDDGIHVKECGDAKPKARDPLIVCKRNAEMSHADNGNVKPLVEPQNPADIFLEFSDVIPNAFFSELTKDRKVFANLFGIDGGTPADLLGGNLHPLVRKQTQAAVVPWKPVHRCLRD